jgi:predicted PurR-regulated permease PerM
MGFTVLAGLTCIQLFLGNYVDPRMEGRILSVSPFVLFLSVIFWGWIWGIPGALMGIPITAGFVIFCKHGKSTRWLARLLEHGPGAERQAEEPQGEQAQDARQ